MEKDRNRDIDNHFLTARDLVLEAEARSTMEVRKTLLNEADAEMRKAISAIRSDIKTTSIHFAKVAGRPYNNLSSQVDTYMNYLIRDLQALKQYVGIRMQILAYLGETKTAALVMNQYQHILYDFLVEPVSKKGLSAAELLHNYFPYQKENMNCWYLYKKEMQPTLEKNIKELRLERGRPVGKEVYIVDLEEVEDGK